MAQEIVFWCDVCLNQDDTRSRSSRHVISLDGKTLGIDLCDTHTIDLIGPLRTALSQYGDKNTDTPVESPYRPAMPKKKGNWPCLLCIGAFGSHYTFVQHLAAVHDTSPQRFYGDRCPIDGETLRPGGPLGAHLAKLHGDKGTTTAEIFKTALNDGDEHGVVADVLAAYEAEHNK